MNTSAGVFNGRLAVLAMRFTTKCFPVCLGGPKRRALNGACGDSSTSHAVSVSRGAYLSPYDRAVDMIERLLRLPSMATYLYPILVDENIKSTGRFKDPTGPLRTLFEHGYTLNMLLNEVESPFVSTINLYERVDEACYQQHQLGLFWRGCIDAGLAPPGVLSSSSEFELTLTTVTAILDVLQERGRLGAADPRYIKPRIIYPAVRAAYDSPRHAVLAAELAQTEVAYMQDLEQLAAYAARVRAQMDVDPSIFAHVDELLALHRAFSMRIQYVAAMPVDRQFFDAVYDDLMPAFDVYSGFCASRELSQRAYQAALPALRQASCGVDPVFDVPSLFMRPVQRLAQYPMLFQSLVDAVCDSCALLPPEDQAARVPVIKSMYAAMRRSKRVLTRANEATREALNQIQGANFYERVDGMLSEDTLGRLLTSSAVSAKTTRDYEDIEAYLFANSLVLCKPIVPLVSSRSARFRQSLSNLHVTLKGMPLLAFSRAEDRRRSASSVSSSTLHSPAASRRARSPTPDDSAADFQLPTIDTHEPSSLISPPAKLLASYVSLATLRDVPTRPPIIKFTSSVDVTLPATCQLAAREPPRLFVRDCIPTNVISQISQVHELNGTMRLTIQIKMASGDEKALVFRRLTQESAAVWVRMLKRTVPLVPVDDENAAQNAYHGLLVNPRFSPSVLGRPAAV
ncbi:Guanine nucleotide exchange factor for Cdc42p [Coemansia thaxteri]|uniref:Guanine nucleotide exchange factor for Cdc42p n=1 Tax=Coemansia thaxteri TaxID=2663907 RepID=A0A9W8EIQ2_9FUNG|nr:Guanine nucleotide exchange factor for Cdc42p [Coemansia thaxteri]KAJ2008960.1 Guanine nucleotide exchange factor for Cdc42p [Coemansia thaxteri]KAJ2473589.1 Guanine nucleotide exchange factor for Cdc42p [Coemansia sp. RSA 2322]KAJ2485877.1 Guanine nucleotide exchange factor for Cdc42p [Coemansia sp. RSA 2320]